MSSVFKTGFLLAVLTAMLVLFGGALGGQQGMLVAFVLAAAMNVASYWFSDRIVLRMYGAQPIDEAQDREITRRHIALLKKAPRVGKLLYGKCCGYSRLRVSWRCGRKET